MYRWRRMTAQQRAAVIEQRRRERKPWHSPPHYENDRSTYYLITAACFEHRHIIGMSPDRMSDFEIKLRESLDASSNTVFAWTVLPNHYHALVTTLSVKTLLSSLGKLHGRTSFAWNGEENRRGRQVWCNATETAIKSEGHYFATLNYVLNNAVHHGYVTRWTEWPYCSVAEYLESVGRDHAEQIWRSYPLYDYGKDWDPRDF